MSVLPFIPWWVDDWTASTAKLTHVEECSYHRILMEMWRQNGHLPNDDAELARIARLRLDRWMQIAHRIRAFLTVDDLGITQKRLLEERQKAQINGAKRKLLAASGGRAKALKYKDRVLLTAYSQHANHNHIDKKEATEGSQAESLAPLPPLSETNPYRLKKHH